MVKAISFFVTDRFLVFMKFFIFKASTLALIPRILLLQFAETDTELVLRVLFSLLISHFHAIEITFEAQKKGAKAPSITKLKPLY